MRKRSKFATVTVAKIKTLEKTKQQETATKAKIKTHEKGSNKRQPLRLRLR